MNSANTLELTFPEHEEKRVESVCETNVVCGHRPANAFRTGDVSKFQAPPNARIIEARVVVAYRQQWLVLASTADELLESLLVVDGRSV